MHSGKGQPIGAHLDIVVARLERFVVERIILGRSLARRPDQCLVCVGEAAAAEIRHRVGFAPDDVVEDPEAHILEHGADAEDVVIGADFTDSVAVGFISRRQAVIQARVK